MPTRFRTSASTLLLAVAALAGGCDMTPTADKEAAARAEARGRAQQKRIQQACASPATNDRLKQVAFDEAIRVRNADPRNLDTLASYTLVRVEDPVVVSRDDALDITVCKGRMVLDLPPGAERAFAGERRLMADVRYSAQRAADGSGLVYQLEGAEPIVAQLANFDLRGQAYRPPATLAANDAVIDQPPPQQPRSTVTAGPRPAPTATPEPRTVTNSGPRATPQPPVRPAPAPTANARAERAYPSFNCRYARSRSEKLVCSSPGLAALDREMSSQFYAALSNSDARTRAELRRSRDRFLAYRDRCPSADCVASAYRDRMDEIEDIARR